MSDDYYTCPICCHRTLPYPRATIIHGHMGWYTEDCSECIRVEELREHHGYGVSIAPLGNTDMFHIEYSRGKE